MAKITVCDMSQLTLLILSIIGVVIAAVGWRRPELVLVPVALLIPSGNFVRDLQVPLGSHGYLTIFQVTGFAVFIVCLARGRWHTEWKKSSGVVVGIAFAIAGTLAAIGSNEFVKSMYFVGTTGLLFSAISFVIGARLREDARAVHLTVIGSALILAVVAILEWKLHRSLLEGFYERHNLAYIPGGTPGFRPPALTGNPLTTSCTLAIAYAVTLVTPYLKRFRLMILGVLAVGVLVTLSRSAVALVLLATVFFVFRGSLERGRRERTVRFKVALVVLPFMIAAIGIAIPHIDQRLGGQSLFSSSGRSETGLRAIDLIKADPRPTGIGLGGFKRLSLSNGYANDVNVAATVDDQWLTYLLEIGWLGYLIVIAGVVVGVRRRDTRGPWLPLLIAVGVGFAFESLEHDATIMMTALALAVATVSGRPVEATAQVAPSPEDEGRHESRRTSEAQ